MNDHTYASGPCTEQKNNLILIGMMGTGKTTAGALAAQALGYTLVDLDAEIVRLEGRSIPELFAEQGEVYFRRAESKALEAVLRGEGQVVATGGGAVLDPANVRLMRQGGLVAALTATFSEIVSRVAGDTNRPLLAGNAEERVRTIMEARKDAYRFADVTVDTTGLTAEQVAEQLVHVVREGNKKRRTGV